MGAVDAVGGDAADAEEPWRTRFLPLSAKSPVALGQLALRYLEWVDAVAAGSNGRAPDSGSLFADMAWTAGIGRSHFGHRAGVVGRYRGGSSRNHPASSPVRPVPRVGDRSATSADREWNTPTIGLSP